VLNYGIFWINQYVFHDRTVTHATLLYSQSTSFRLFKVITRPYQDLSIKTLTAIKHHALIVLEEMRPDDGLE
jgi:hypothetical protein